MESKKKDIYLKVVFTVIAIIVLALIIVIAKNNVKIDSEDPDVNSGDNSDIKNTHAIETPGSYELNKAGDFKLNGPQVYVLEEAQNLYKETPIGTKISDLIDRVGEPISKKEYLLMTSYTFDIGHLNLLKVSTMNDTNEIVEKLVIINSIMDENTQLSTEIGTDITDISERYDKLTNDMTFDEVVAILGTKYIEVEETNKGIRMCVWFDIYENRLEISFENDKVYEIFPIMPEW